MTMNMKLALLILLPISALSGGMSPRSTECPPGVQCETAEPSASPSSKPSEYGGVCVASPSDSKSENGRPHRKRQPSDSKSKAGKIGLSATAAKEHVAENISSSTSKAAKTKAFGAKSTKVAKAGSCKAAENESCVIDTDCCVGTCYMPGGVGIRKQGRRLLLDSTIRKEDIPAECGDEMYDVTLHALPGPHFILAATKFPESSNDSTCPESLAFDTMYGGIFNKQILSPHLDEDFKDFPKHTLGVAALADALKAEENAEAINAASFHLVTNNCLTYASSVWRRLGFDVTEDLNNFLIDNILLNQAQLTEMTSKFGERRLLGAISNQGYEEFWSNGVYSQLYLKKEINPTRKLLSDSTITKEDIPAECGDEMYDVTLHALPGPHFILATTKSPESSNDSTCPKSLAFDTMYGGIFNKQILSPHLVDQFKDLPKHTLGVAALADALKAEENAEAINAASFHLVTNNCLTYASSVWRRLGFDVTEDLNNFLIDNILLNQAQLTEMTTEFGERRLLGAISNQGYEEFWSNGVYSQLYLKKKEAPLG